MQLWDLFSFAKDTKNTEKTFCNVAFCCSYCCALYWHAISSFCFAVWCGRLRSWTAGSKSLLSRCFRPISLLRLAIDEARLISFFGGVIASLCLYAYCAYGCVDGYFYVRVSWLRNYWICCLMNYLRECYFRWVSLVWEHIEVNE